MQAWEYGKTVEVLSCNSWCEINEEAPEWFPTLEYRIKPDTYAPFDTVEGLINAWGYGCEPPDGDEEITEMKINYSYNEETGEDVTITDDLKKKIEAELWKRR